VRIKEVFTKAGVKPRRGQIEAAEAILERLIDNKSVAFIAPTGFGKTLTVLAALKAADRLPTVWRVRSLALGTRISEDASLLSLRSFTAAGREKTCPLAEGKGSDVHEYCRNYRLSCKYFLETDFSRQVTASSWIDLLGLKGCPYYLQDKAMEGADVVIQSYYRRPPRFYRAVVWDEAHNLLVPKETCVTTSMLMEAAVELKILGEEDLAGKLASIRPLDTGAFFVEERLLFRLYRAYMRMLAKGQGNTVTGKIYRVLSSEAVYWEAGRLCGTRLSIPWSRHPAIYVSATLVYPELLGVDEVVKITWNRKREAVVTAWLSTKYGQLEKYLEEYGYLLSALKFRFPRVLVFATRRVASKLRHKIGLYEPEMKALPREWSGIMLLHSRGRFAEGVDIRADAVVMLGAPYLPPYASERVKKALQRAGVEGDYVSASMLSTTLQCIGRTTRGLNDDPFIVLADRRYENYASQLSEYFKITVVSSLDEFIIFAKQKIRQKTKTHKDVVTNKNG